MTDIGRDPDVAVDPLHIAAVETADVPAVVATWLARLRVLKGVPFNYLVPDPNLLPPESIRFFRLDFNWIDCLLDGAFSLGRATSGDFAHDQAGAPSVRAAIAAATALSMPPAEQIVTGFLLRSIVVQGWPGLEVSAYPRDGAAALPMLRSERLSPTVLLCLFDGLIDHIDIHEPPEGLHFGVDLDRKGELDAKTFVKNLRPLAGQALPPDPVVEIPYRPGPRQVLDISALAGKIAGKFAVHPQGKPQPFTAAEFALQMVEGVGLVRFVVAPPHPS